MLIEILETRRHFSATLVNGTLTVTGTPLSDTITINVNPTIKGITYFTTTVTVANSKGSVANSFATSAVHEIVVSAGDDNDVVQLTGNCTIPATINGNAGNDSLFGGNGPDKIFGGDGNDVIDGRGGIDQLNGENGNDTFRTGSTADGSNALFGGAGIDVADYSTRTHSLNISLDNVANDGETGENDNVQADVENVSGGSADDTLAGGVWIMNNTLWGNGGNDRLNGAWGDDVLFGGAGNDTLCGDYGNDSCYGEAGNDRLDDYQNFLFIPEDFGSDVYSGGADIDTISYQQRLEHVRVSIDNFADDGFNFTAQHFEFDNVMTDVENLYGTYYADVLHGSTTANEIQGGPGDDSIWGEGGHDSLFGGSDNDELQAGFDGQGCFFDGGQGKDKLVGNAGNDTFNTAGDGDHDTIVGNGGMDVFNADPIDSIL